MNGQAGVRPIQQISQVKRYRKVLPVYPLAYSTMEGLGHGDPSDISPRVVGHNGAHKVAIDVVEELPIVIAPQRCHIGRIVGVADGDVVGHDIIRKIDVQTDWAWKKSWGIKKAR